MLALIIAGFLLTLGNSKPTTEMQRLSARLENLQTIIDQGTAHTKGGDLRKVHSDASILITGDIARINDALKSAGLKKVPKEIAALEQDTATLENLKDAQLNGRFDDAYKKALSQKLESTMVLMRELHHKTKSRDLKGTLATSYSHFNGILDQLSKL